MLPPDTLARLIVAPSPADVRALQSLLLAARSDAQATRDVGRLANAERALDLASFVHDYLCELESKLSAREYSHLASMLDIGAVGAVAAENLADPERRQPVQIALAALSEGLMVLASRQYVKAWDRELRPVAARAAWRCRDELWRLSVESQPNLSADDRSRSIDPLLAPLFADDSTGEARHALVGRILQLLLIALAARALGDGVPHGALRSA